MAHNLEIVDGKASMAYAGEVPWHGLGKRVPPDLTPGQMLEAAGLDWTVEKFRAYVDKNGQKIQLDKCALVRSSDSSVLSIVSPDWNEVQNEEAFDFFNEFVMAADMEMETAGSLCGGQIVWALARVKNPVELFGGDRIDPYMLLTNFHRYGCCNDIRHTAIRAVCWNTLMMALSEINSNYMLKINHRRKFDVELAKAALGVSYKKLGEYTETAAFLGSKKAKDEDIVEYLSRVFLTSGDELSRNGKRVFELIETQPGSQFAQGSWWGAYNAVTYFVDHLAGQSQDTRLTSAWYGPNSKLKTRALDQAVALAKAS